MPFNSRSSNGTETFANRFVQYGLIWRYSIFFAPAMISASHSRFIVVVIRSYRTRTIFCLYRSGGACVTNLHSTNCCTGIVVLISRRDQQQRQKVKVQSPAVLWAFCHAGARGRQSDADVLDSRGRSAA